MTDISQLSSTAQSIVHALEQSAQFASQMRGWGYAQVDEFTIGGLGPNEPLTPEERAEWTPSPQMAAIAELREAGIDVRVSGGEPIGEFGRMICLVGTNGGPVKVTQKRQQQQQRREAGQGEVAIGAGIAVFVVVLIVGLFMGFALTKEWRRDIDGRAKLAEARNASKVKTEKARAAFESAKFDAKSDLEIAEGNARAEIARARGTAKAVAIENGAITDSYTRYLYVKNLAHANVVYVPTEAGLPILEARRQASGG